MKFPKFSELRWWQKLLGIVLVSLFFSVFIWIVINLIRWLFNVHQSMNSVFIGTTSLYCWLFSWLAAFVTLIFLLIWNHKKFLGKFKDSPNASDLETHWLTQWELQLIILVIQDEIQTTYPTWCIAGIEKPLLTKNKLDKEPCSYHILACDKKILNDKFAKEGREYINGDKLVNNVTAGATIVIGGAGSGKTLQVVKPTITHLLNMKPENRSSMIICDLKGDIYKETANFAKKQGFNVYRFNTTNSKFSHSWNPLGEIWTLYYEKYLPNWLKCYKHDTNQIQLTQEEYSQAKVESFTAKGKIEKKLDIIVNLINPINPESKDQFFDKKAQDLIKLYFLLPLDYGIDKIDYTLYSLSANALTYEDKLTILQDMLPEWALSKQLAPQFINIKDQTSLTDVKHTAAKAITNFTIQEIKDLTAEDNEKSIDFEKFIKEPTVIYVSIDTVSPDSANNRLAVLFMEMLYAYLIDYLALHDMKAYERAILFIIDEFGNIPRMDFMLNIFAANRGQNIMAMLILQSATGQINETYSINKRRTLFDNTQCFILTSGVDPEFAQELSARSGSSYRQMVNKSYSENGKTSQSESMQYTPDIAASEFCRLKPYEMIIFPTNAKPCKIKYKKANTVKFYRDIWNSTELAIDQSYGKQSLRELDYIKEDIPNEIISLWVQTYNKDGVSKFRSNLANELAANTQTIQLTTFNDKQLKALAEFYTKYGGFPCKALKIIGEESDLNLTKLEHKELEIVNNQENIKILPEPALKSQTNEFKLFLPNLPSNLAELRKLMLEKTQKVYFKEKPNWHNCNAYLIIRQLLSDENILKLAYLNERQIQLITKLINSEYKDYAYCYKILNIENNDINKLTISKIIEKYNLINNPKLNILMPQMYNIRSITRIIDICFRIIKNNYPSKSLDDRIAILIKELKLKIDVKMFKKFYKALLNWNNTIVQNYYKSES